MHAHIDTIFLAYRHDSGKEIPHVFTKLVAGNALILLKQPLEYRHRVQVTFLDVSIDESLCLHDDGIYKICLLRFCDHLVQRLHLLKNLSGIISLRPFSFKNPDIEVSKSRIIEEK